MNTSTQQYIEELQTNSHILGIILFGSWARGNNRPDSDVDLLVIVQHGFKRTVEYREGQAFEITYTTEQGAMAYWQSNPDDAIELWNIAKVLFDRDGTLARLQKSARELKEKGKLPLTADQHEHYKFDAHDQLKAIAGLATSDPATARMLLSTKVFQLTELFFDTRQLWTPPPKQRLAIIKDINHNLYNLISRYYDESSIFKQITIVQSIITIVFDT
jgi:predicted nucleotidyltransferase